MLLLSSYHIAFLITVCNCKILMNCSRTPGQPQAALSSGLQLCSFSTKWIKYMQFWLSSAMLDSTHTPLVINHIDVTQIPFTIMSTKQEKRKRGENVAEIKLLHRIINRQYFSKIRTLSLPNGNLQPGHIFAWYVKRKIIPYCLH